METIRSICNELDLLLAQHTSEVGAGNTFTEYVTALRKRETLKNDVTCRERKAAIQEQLAMYVALQPSGTNQLGPSLSILRQEASKDRMNAIALVYTKFTFVILSNIVILIHD